MSGFHHIKTLWFTLFCHVGGNHELPACMLASWGPSRFLHSTCSGNAKMSQFCCASRWNICNCGYFTWENRLQRRRSLPWFEKQWTTGSEMQCVAHTHSLLSLPSWFWSFNLFAVQGTFRSLLQLEKASIFRPSAFFMVQFSQSYRTTGNSTALTIWTFVGRVVSLLFNTLPRFLIAFLTRNNRLLISWLQSLSIVILEPKKRKSVTTSTFYPSICHAPIGLDTMILAFLIFSLKPVLSLSPFTFIKMLFAFCH